MCKIHSENKFVFNFSICYFDFSGKSLRNLTLNLEMNFLGTVCPTLTKFTSLALWMFSAFGKIPGCFIKPKPFNHHVNEINGNQNYYG